MDPVQIIDSSGEAVVTTPYWFDDDADAGADSLTIVSILGGQASGKSTLLNTLFKTNFSVAARSAIATATTKGIFACKSSITSHFVALDVEGSDSRERGRDGHVFHNRLASFVAAISDVIILNVWYHDVGRFDAAGYALLREVFTEAQKIAEQDPGQFRTRLIFAVRDVDNDIDQDSLHDLLNTDAEDIFKDISKSVALSDLFDIVTIPLPHMRHREADFNAATEALAARFTSPDEANTLLNSDYCKGIPADGCGTFTRSLWESHYTSRSVTTAQEASDTPDSLLAAFKCNEAFSDALNEATNKMKSFQTSSLDEGEKIEALGTKTAEVMNEALAAYDAATEDFKEDSIQSRKRRELESIIDTTQHAMFMKQIQVLRENALAHFKSATASDDMPSDLAFYTADSLFQREADESKRPGSSWSANQERTDLQNMMQEISTQRKRLLTSQVNAAQQQAHAMQYLQMQQSQMNAIQAQAYGGGAGQWNVGAAYRPPDTNINASLSYQQGRTNIQISMVPDESASLLGPNGFTAGVGPGNLGLSFNIGL